jgi:ClpP class serine protease
MDSIANILSILTSNSSRLSITKEEYVCALLNLLPAMQQAPSKESFLWEPPSYAKIIEKQVKAVQAIAEAKGINLTNDYASQDLPDGSLAYYRIQGMIMSDGWWYFSSKQFEQQLLVADANPSINAHFLHITSGGGEAWYLDRLHETMMSLQKPIYTFVEKAMGSAAYYIGCHGKTIKALTQNDLVGSIGVMISFSDIIPYLEKLGIKFIEEYATKSDLKNKKYNDLLKGKPEQYITEELDPMQQQFEANVRDGRKAMRHLPEDAPVFRGESYYASVASTKDIALVDGLATLPEALQEANEMGQEWADKNAKQQNIIHLLK